VNSTDLLTLIVVALFVAGLIVMGARRGEPAWVIGGTVAGVVTLFIGIRWAAGIGSDAFYAALVVAVGMAVWAQTEHLWWRLRGR
jgi:hypothetical protein